MKKAYVKPKIVSFGMLETFILTGKTKKGCKTCGC